MSFSDESQTISLFKADIFAQSECIFIYIVFVILFAWVWRNKPRTYELRKLGLNKSNFLLGMFAAHFLMLNVVSIYSQRTPENISFVTFVSLVLLELVIISLSNDVRLIKWLASVFFVSFLAVYLISDQNLGSVLTQVDQHVICERDMPFEACSTRLENFNKADNGVVSAKPSDVLQAIFYFLSFFFVVRYYIGALRIFRKATRDKALVESDIEAAAIAQLSFGASIVLSFMIALLLTGADLPSLGIFYGLIGAGVSIALRDVLNDWFAGIILRWGTTLNTGNVITIDGGGYGIVNGIGPRCTSVVDRNDIITLIPNSELLNSRVENWTQKDDRVRLKVDVGVSYNSNLDEVASIMISSVRGMARIEHESPPKALVMGFDDSSVQMQLRFWVKKPKDGIRNIMSQVYSNLFAAFRDSNIGIPFPQSEIRILNADEFR